MRSDAVPLVIFFIVIISIVIAVASYQLKEARAAVKRSEGTVGHWRDMYFSEQSNLHATQNSLQAEQKKLRELGQRHETLTTIIKETSSFYPSLAQAIADFRTLEHEQLARQMLTKPRPAKRAAESVKEAVKARKEAERRFKLLQYQLSYYETAFPWLLDISGRSVEELLAEYQAEANAEDQDSDDGDDAVKKWISVDEYKRLSSSEKSDLALKRWKESRKTNWQIGREYERAVGYEFERHGYSIEYFGALKGFEDMGRDLIATKDGITYLIQCKFWAEHRLIHEKHIFQLIGTGLEYACQKLNLPIEGLHLRSSGIVPLLITSTQLSETARKAAELIDVETREQYRPAPYPQVKCNINNRTGEKIYHLPFDQQYDTTRIDVASGEAYVETAKEAERRGFRRAKRHRTSSAAE